jgi:hypothetical protein
VPHAPSEEVTRARTRSVGWLLHFSWEDPMGRRGLALVAAFALLAPVGAPLADDLAAEIARCARITDSLQRLTCYDGVAGTAARTTSSTPTAAPRAVSTTRAEVGGRCQATTRKGSQCKRSAKSGSSYCWQHGG